MSKPKVKAMPRTARLRFACIDMGSNSSKLLVVEVDARGKWKTLLDERIGTSLGKDLLPDGTIPAENKARVRAALRQFVHDAQRLGVKAADIGFITTAAMRQAPNGAEVLEELKAECGLVRGRILAGEDEARSGFLGALAMFRNEGSASDNYATIDLGGGSFQLAIGTRDAFARGGSASVGSNFVLQEALPRGATTYGAADYAAADARLRAGVAMPLDPTLLEGRTLVAIGGVSKFLRAHFGKDLLSRSEIDALRHEIGALPVDERNAVVQRGKDATTMRALGIDTPEGAKDYGAKLPASATLLLHIMNGIGVDELRVSETDARHEVIRGVLGGSSP